MFTGIVEELGRVRTLEHVAGGARLVIEAEAVLSDVATGDSIAVNGCCLTVVERGDGWWAADAVRETLDRSCLGVLEPRDAVNLERPVRLADRLGGHLVQGHVDAVGRVASVTPLPDGSLLMSIEVDAALLRYIVEKGSIAVDGVSLTVASVEAGSFGVAVIPHTASVTTLGIKGPGASVNLEVDIVAKYVERLLGERAGSGVTA